MLDPADIDWGELEPELVFRAPPQRLLRSAELYDRMVAALGRNIDRTTCEALPDGTTRSADEA